jgi:hypothetical protein
LGRRPLDRVETQHTFLREWAEREFGAEHSTEVAQILDQYYRLGFQRKPEHLQWYLPAEPQRASDLTNTEKLNRLDAYAVLENELMLLTHPYPQLKKDAFYELVVYPVRCAALANERFFAAEIAREYGTRWPATGVKWASRSIAADAAITAETNYFNNLIGGKWRYIMSPR